MNETPKLLRLTSIAHKNSNALYSLLIRCHVTPASRCLQGIKKICNEQVYVHVGSEPRKGEANAAVAKVLSEVRCNPNRDVEPVLGIPKSDITIAGKQRTKIGQVNGIDIGRLSQEAYLSRVKQKLADACLEKPQE